MSDWSDNIDDNLSEILGREREEFLSPTDLDNLNMDFSLFPDGQIDNQSVEDYGSEETVVQVNGDNSAWSVIVDDQLMDAEAPAVTITGYYDPSQPSLAKFAPQPGQQLIHVQAGRDGLLTLNLDIKSRVKYENNNQH